MTSMTSMTSTATRQLQDLRPGFEATRLKLLRSRHLPGLVYSSPAIYALEKERIFMRSWLSVGRVEQLANVGDFMTIKVMDEPLVIARHSADEIVCFVNMCLHRGVEVAVGRGNAKDFSCPYHAWLYDTAGKLIVAPGMKESEVDMGGFGMKRLQVRLWRGWIFVNCAQEPEPFEQFIAPFEKALWWFQSEKCRLAGVVEIDVKCNWKFLVENLIDMYHVGVIHRSTFGGFVKGARIDYVLLRNGGWHTRYEARPHSSSGAQVFPTLPWLAAESPGMACKAGIYPNLNISLRADSLRMWHVWPQSPGTTRVACYLLFPEAAFGIPDFALELKKYSRFVEQIIAEDSVMVESLQNAAASRFFEPGPMAPLEERSEERRVGKECA